MEDRGKEGGSRLLPGRLASSVSPLSPDGRSYASGLAFRRVTSPASRGRRGRVQQTYEIHCGGRVVSRVQSYTARHAVTDFLRSLGCPDDEMESVSSDQIAWRGAVYSGIPTTEPTSSTSSQPER